MKRMPFLVSIVVFSFLCLFLKVSSWGAALPDTNIHDRVTSIVNSKNNVHIQGIRVERGEQDWINLEIKANLGDCWGKNEIAKGFARETMKNLFASDLPIQQITVKVYQGDKMLLTVALGRNPAKNLKWDEKESLSSFYNHLQSNTNYNGNPSDRCLVIENGAEPRP